MKLRVGVVGLGPSWQQRYRPALRVLADRFDVRAVYEPVTQLARQAAQEFNASAVDGFRALAFREDVDAVLALSRQWYGSLPIVAACDAGKAVYCVNGLELDLQRATVLKERVEGAGIAFMAEFPRRHASATVRLKELIATQLGAPKILFCHLRIPTEPPTNGRLLGAMSDSPLHQFVELVDWCRYVVGRDPTSVSGLKQEAKVGDTRGDYHMMSLQFGARAEGESPAIAQISVGRYVPGSWPEAVTFRPPAALQVACENGLAFVDLPASLIWFDSAGRHMESLDSERPLGEAMLCQFHRNVTSLVRRTQSLEDAYKALCVVLSAMQSHEEGRRIQMDLCP